MNRRLAPLAGLVALAALLRFATLDARGYWLDEVLTVDILREGFGGMLSRLGEPGGGGPVYFFVAWPWAQVFGTSEVALRFLSALFGTATVPVAYWAARELASRRAGLIAAALAATSPLLVWQSQEVRPYALLVLLGGVSFALFLRVRRDPAGGAPAAWAAASALLVATHYVAIFMVALEALLLLREHTGRRVRLAVLAVGAAAAALVPLVLAGREGGLAELPEESGILRRLLVLPAEFLAGPQPPLQVLTPAVAGLIALLAVALLIRRADGEERTAAVLAGGIGVASILLAAAFSLSGSDLVLTRYLSEVWIPAAAVASVGFATAGARRWGRLAAGTLCALFAAVVVATAWEPKFDREDWRGAAHAIGSPSTRRAIVTTPGRGPATFAYYRPQARAMTPAGGEVGEIVYVAFPSSVQGIGRKPDPPPAEAVAAAPAGFSIVERERHEFFTLARLRSARPTRVTIEGLAAAVPGSVPAVFLEPAGAQARR
ncbi:MAG: glycosyltransferase family 39 protein [Actinomycetota bacterium]|nr:glycosyltransferase family 39 protein [Actinomycetota bacterium]